ncbi:serine/threonine-protein kinase [Rhodococcus pyridinivorans]|uniref:non-specific serine/threonine protein kinase n=1 Tax=Rhodococcus pyridinivorans TaxID=103816 RepID=A0A7M2XM91_9NOCA|nr:serine/threonine-protein kinase [Rhodococcus pyridinivorans]QOV98533.1 serine/threonine protein kinase [Rhodococcus pyridinivorans]WMM72426.1 serine/threonine-protein kinase [Rhodococcus pyridinivorans]
MTVHKVLDGRYELSGLLGVGGSGEIHDGWDTRLHRPIAVKLLGREVCSRPDVRRRFEVEARAAAALNHPRIVAVYDTGEHDGRPYIVMERLPGRTLADDITRGPLPADRVRTVLAGILEALVAAHGAGILHRDIKPANVLITENGEIKVADFGIAKSVGDDLTHTGELVGTVAYLSPDRITGHLASVTDDLYAVGIVGYESLCGRRPFAEDNILALARAITHDRPRPLADLRPDAHPGFVAVIERAMAREPSDRFRSAHEMLVALQNSDGNRAATAFLPASEIGGPTTTAGTDRSRGVLVAAGLTLVGALAVGGLALGFGRGDSPPAATPETRTPGMSASTPERVPATTELPAPPESTVAPARTVDETAVVPPVVPAPETTPVAPPADAGPTRSEPESRGNSGPGNNNGNGNGNSQGNNGNHNGNNGNGNGNTGNGNSGRGNG